MGHDNKMQDVSMIPTGIRGLDDILHGGVAANRLYLIEGDPGSGKTTLALQFLLAGVELGESCLFVTLSESRDELEASAASHGWGLKDIPVLELIVSDEKLKPEARYTMFHPSEVELGDTIMKVLAETERVKPARLVFDSLSELRLLAENPLRYRRQIQALKKFFSHRQCTTLFVDDQAGEERDMHLHSLVHGVISLERKTIEYGSMRRMLQVRKMRGRSFREGYHDFVIRRGGLELYPRLVAAEHHTKYERVPIMSGLEPLDSLLGGGPDKGTSTLILGAAGTGKSSLATQYVCASAARGEHTAVFLFDESVDTYLQRAAGIGLDMSRLVRSGHVMLRQVDPAELSPSEFAHAIRDAVEQGQAKLVVIDSLSGYLNAMPSERFLTLHLHELLTYLSQQGVTTFMLMAQHGLIGNSSVETPVDASYLADNVLLLRYFELRGEVRMAISVIKKRTGKHERTIRELTIDRRLSIGAPMKNFQGVLTGLPQVLAQEPSLSEV